MEPGFRQARIRFLADQNFSHMLTLAWNNHLQANAESGTCWAGSYKVSFEQARHQLRSLQARVDERFFGRRFFKFPPEIRTEFVAFVENPAINFHVHSLWRVPADKFERFEAFFVDGQRGLWNKIVPSGSHRLRRVNNVEADANYCTKGQHAGSDYMLEIWSRDFAPEKTERQSG
jgi:hypothetical protein